MLLVKRGQEVLKAWHVGGKWLMTFKALEDEGGAEKASANRNYLEKSVLGTQITWE